MEIVLDGGGYIDSKGVRHNHVTFDKRLDGAALFAIDESPMAAVSTQLQLMTVAATITKFGTLMLPVPLDVLLKLDIEDIKALRKAHNKFMADGVGERQVEFPSNSEVKLAFGYQDNGVTYTRCTFGVRLNGYDLVAADKEGHAEGTMRREYFLIGREITGISTDDGQHKLAGPFDVSLFAKLDVEDFMSLRIAATRWRESFRSKQPATLPFDAQASSQGSGNLDSSQSPLESARDTEPAA
jgi:hypothetical protein